MSSRGSTDYSCPKIPLVYVFNATLFTNLIQTAFIFRFPYQSHYKTGVNDMEGTGGILDFIVEVLYI